MGGLNRTKLTWSARAAADGTGRIQRPAILIRSHSLSRRSGAPDMLGEAASLTVGSVLNGVQVPGSGHAFQLMLAAIRKVEFRADDQVGNSTRHPHRLRLRPLADARSDVHRDTSDIVSADFDFASVKADTYVKAKLANGVSDRTRTLDRARWTIESRKKSITSCLDLPAMKSLELATHRPIVMIKQIMPATVAELTRPSRRRHDVRE